MIIGTDTFKMFIDVDTVKFHTNQVKFSFDKPVTITDTLRLMKLRKNHLQWLGLNTFGAVIADSLSTATFGLSTDIPSSAAKYLVDTVNGEIRWYYKDTTGVKYTYNLSGLRPSYQLQSLMASSEINKRYIARLESKVNKLEVDLIVFFVLLVTLIIVDIRREK